MQSARALVNTPARLAWPLIAALGVTMIVGYGSVFYSFSLLLGPVQAELGAPKQLLVGAFSLALLAWGLCSPWVGLRIDRHGGRGVMTAGSLISGVLLLALSQAQSALGFTLAWAGIGVAMACTLYEPAFGVLTRVHRANARRAITMLTLIGGFASTVFWPLGQWLVATFGWRGACVALGAAQLLVSAPLHWFAIGRDGHWARRIGSDDGATDGQHPRAEAAPVAAATPSATLPAAARAAATPSTAHRATPAVPERSASLREALSEPTFWGLAAAFVSYQFVFSATAVHFIPMMQAKGLSAAAAASIGAMLGPMQVLGRVVELLFGSRLPIVKVGRVAVLMMPSAMLWYTIAPGSVLALALFPLLYGAGNGVMTIVRGAVPVELYGVERYASISGALAAPTMLATALGPVLSSLLWSPDTGYRHVALALAGVGLAGAFSFHLAAGSRRARRSAGHLHPGGSQR